MKYRNGEFFLKVLLMDLWMPMEFHKIPDFSEHRKSLLITGTTTIQQTSLMATSLRMLGTRYIWIKISRKYFMIFFLSFYYYLTFSSYIFFFTCSLFLCPLKIPVHVGDMQKLGGKFKEVYNESDVLVKPLSGSPVLGSTWSRVSPVLWPPVRAQPRGERFVLGHSLHRHQEGLLIRTGEHLPRHPSEEDRWPDQSVRILWKKQGEVSPAVETRKHQR